ncbi:actinin alpha 2 [Tritrichomonas musculus]|uniref:Actinin alpha 2 n=1 Tax=Tritrichomonas musculus TaxID=1915356 RepID=A0ABR2K1K6_9EUKA
MVTNNDMAIDMFTRDGVQFVGISGKDIHDSKEKLVLGLVWTLILRYSIGQSIDTDSKVNSTSAVSSSASSKNNKDALMQWAIERTENYPNINDFKPYDLSMCALLDSYVPDKINFYSLNAQDTQHNAELATKVMKDHQEHQKKRLNHL